MFIVGHFLEKMAESASERLSHTGTGSGARSLPKAARLPSWHKPHRLIVSILVASMIKKKWLALFLVQVCLVVCLTSYINKYDALGWLSFGIVFIAIPYTLYKALEQHHLGLLFAIGAIVPLGFSWGLWIRFYEDYRLAKESVRTKGVVTATWTIKKRYGGREKLFRVRFKTNYDYREIFSHKNTLNYQVGDSVLINYLPSEPNTYRIIN